MSFTHPLRKVRYPDPSEGIRFRDDFAWGGTSSANMGERRWLSAPVGGGAALAVAGHSLTDADRAAKAIGVVLVRSQAVVGQGSAWSSAGSNMSIPFVYGQYFGTGSYLEARVRNEGSLVDIETWAGIVDDNDVSPLTAAAVKGVFFRRVGDGAGAGKWTGVVKNGAADETTVELVSGAEDLVTWYVFQALRTATGVQFYVDGVATGAEVTADLPADSLLMAPTLGCVTQDAGSAIRSWAIDWFDLYLKVSRP